MSSAWHDYIAKAGPRPLSAAEEEVFGAVGNA
jgi:hypothetical protein